MKDFPSLKLYSTADGSHTVTLSDEGVTYHSRQGAITESKHIYIGYGFRDLDIRGTEELRILEVGFGTGLNALLTMLEGSNRVIQYDAIEPYPLPQPIWSKLNYGEALGGRSLELLREMHLAPMNVSTAISQSLSLYKIQSSLQEAILPGGYTLIYFDPFDPDYQPELWTAAIFQKLYAAAAAGCVMVTYSAKGDVRRAMESAGFEVERLPGPPGKFHVTRARKR